MISGWMRKGVGQLYKSSYFQPILKRFSASDSVVGKYSGEMNLIYVKELEEYFWSCGTMNSDYTKVLKSEPQEFSVRFETFFQSILIVYSDFNLYDEIRVYDNRIILYKISRELIVETTKTKTIKGIKR